MGWCAIASIIDIGDYGDGIQGRKAIAEMSNILRLFFISLIIFHGVVLRDTQ